MAVLPLHLRCYRYYPAPANFTNAAITGGPIHGGTTVVIEGSGFTRGYRSEGDIDLTNLIMRCRFTDKPSVVSFRACPRDPASLFPRAIPLAVVFDVPTNGMQLATDALSGQVRLLTAAAVDELFTFARADGTVVRLAEQVRPSTHHTLLTPSTHPPPALLPPSYALRPSPTSPHPPTPALTPCALTRSMLASG